MPIDDEFAEASNEEIEIQPLLPEQQAVPKNYI